MRSIREEAARQGNDEILNWLSDKEGKRSWVLKCVSRATTKMKRDDWNSTSDSTNLAESAHALSQRDGTKLTLVAAIERARRLDQRFLEGKNAAENMGIMSRHGNQTLTGRTERNLKRSKKAAAKKNKSNKDPILEAFEMAQKLITEGIPKETVNDYLKRQMDR